MHDKVLAKISKCKSGVLNLAGFVLRDRDLAEIVTLINQNKLITGLITDRAYFSDNAVVELIKLHFVTTLTINHDNISHSGLITLLNSNKFTSLNLDSNWMIKDGDAVYKAVLANNTCEHLSLQETLVENDIIQKIATHCNKNFARTNATLKLPEKFEEQKEEHKEEHYPSTTLQTSLSNVSTLFGGASQNVSLGTGTSTPSHSPPKFRN